MPRGRLTRLEDLEWWKIFLALAELFDVAVFRVRMTGVTFIYLHCLKCAVIVWYEIRYLVYR